MVLLALLVLVAPCRLVHHLHRVVQRVVFFSHTITLLEKYNHCSIFSSFPCVVGGGFSNTTIFENGIFTSFIACKKKYPIFFFSTYCCILCCIFGTYYPTKSVPQHKNTTMADPLLSIAVGNNAPPSYPSIDSFFQFVNIFFTMEYMVKYLFHLSLFIS